MITKKEFDKLSAEDKATKIAEMKALIADAESSTDEKNSAKEILSAADGSGLPKWFREIIGLGGKIIFGSEKETNAPAPKDEPASTQPGKEVAPQQPAPIGLKAKKLEKAKKEMESKKEAAEEAVKKVKACKEAAEKEDASEEDMAAYKKAKEEAEEAAAAYESAEKAHQKAVEADDDDDENEGDDDKKSKNNSGKGEITTNAAKNNPVMKPAAQVKDELKLASAPSHQARVKQIGGGKTFSQLRASTDENDKRLLGRVMTEEAGGKDIADYAAILGSIMADGKLSAIVEKTRIMMNVSQGQVQAYQRNPTARSGGINLHELSAQFGRGEIDMMGRDNVMRKITTLTSTDNALASPALNTIEWLSLAIFQLFPSTSWKNEIPLFGAEVTGKNTGIIWANIAAAPTIYRGSQPSSPTPYSISDTAVSLSLTPFWMQPMLWTPLTMHQLRYNQMGTQWAQAFSLLNATIDDYLIYTLASTVPAGSIVKSSGLSGYQTSPLQFNIANATDPNAFFYGSFTGSLLAPVLNDIVTLEQIYNKQNFDLASERPTLVTDPTMEGLLAKDPETKSLLTRWVNQEGGEFVKFKHTIMPGRSRVAIYDPATGQIKDPAGTIPSTAVSAGLSFIPSQVGMGLGMLDVFMVQNPAAYGYEMSADIRIGIAPLRANNNGTAILTYGAATNPSNA